MIRVLEGFPEATVAVACEGHVTREDYERILIPRVNEALAGHDKLRLYYEIGPSFSGIDVGAVWEDTKVGLEHLSRWERMALVTDVGWIRLAVGAFRFAMPGKLRVFDLARADEARSWIRAAA
jgi:SpoIIAA-like